VRPLSVDPNRISESVGHRRITVRVRFPRIAFLFACAVSLALPLAAQSTNGTINGRVLDPSNKVIGGADILVINDATGVQYSGKTNEDGIYVVPNLPPGAYRLQVSKVGFKTLIKPDIVLNIQDALSINFTLPVGAVFETVTVEGGASMINTTDASVSTVVDQTFVKNMPLNGRSFQDLILLTPGVVTQTPQPTGASGLGRTGEFSVNGQRPEDNYYTVDGVSSNLGTSALYMTAGASPSGSLPTATALGTTQALVSVDDLQEFRVQSSTYSAQYGRNPGGQFAFETKSGSNRFHGTAYDYLRNGALDAQDWFNDYFGTPELSLRQNDFGGTFGGPVKIPSVYKGTDKTFFFVSYEGLRLRAPQAATANFVPDLCMRGMGVCPSGRNPAASALFPALRAFPLPSPNGVEDATNGIGQFIGSWSSPASLNSTSVRFDHVVNDKLRLFFRFSDTGSSLATRGASAISQTPSMLITTGYTLRTYTLGGSYAFSPRISNEARLNYSSNVTTNNTSIDALGGSTPVDLARLTGLSAGSEPGVGFLYGGYQLSILQERVFGTQRQWNLVDTANLTLGRHQFKFGIDYRKLAPFAIPATPLASFLYFGESAVETNSPLTIAIAYAPAYPLYTNFSVFGQDEWRVSQRLSLSLGLRWEVNPAPGVTQGLKPYTVQGSSASTWTLAPQGTPLWQTTYGNFAPRLGAAYVIRNTPAWETVLRVGGGLFFDTGQQLGSIGFSGPGFSALAFLPVSFPGPVAVPAIVNPPIAPYSTVYGVAPHLQLPYTIQWNSSIEQALGKSQAFTVSYVGSHAGRLLQQNAFEPTNNPVSSFFYFVENGLTSDYDSVQIQFRRRLSRGLTALASYTLSHCLDYGSQNYLAGYQRGNCDFDVRHSFSTAFSYDLPNLVQNGFLNAVLRHWGLDGRFTARTAFPVTLEGKGLVQPNGQIYNEGLSFVPGQPVYLYGASCASVLQGLHDLNPGQGCPGGRAINPNAFMNVGSGYGDAPRNFARGFGAWQMDLAARRDFPINERLKLQFRGEAFNLFNHPNFGSVSPYFGTTTFGQATATLANSLGVLNPLYQMGGSRSMQFALKLVF
jgi:hypothetical protein